MSRPGRGTYGQGYRLHFKRDRGALLEVQRDLTSGELRALVRALRGTAGSIVRAKSLHVHLDVPLSQSLAVTLDRITQEGELITTVSVPALVRRGQLPLDYEVTRLPTSSWLKVTPRDLE